LDILEQGQSVRVKLVVLSRGLTSEGEIEGINLPKIDGQIAYDTGTSSVRIDDVLRKAEAIQRPFCCCKNLRFPITVSEEIWVYFSGEI
jgi:hypothetical protein